jgi:hypothetical protein
VIKAMDSWGDHHKELSLLDNTLPDIFTRELDEALLRGDGDAAVHSAKDLPYPLAQGLEVGALLAPANPSDCLVSRGHQTLRDLPANSRIGASSRLRQAQIRQLRPDVAVVDLRGTIGERMNKIQDGEVDAVVVATCALQRLNLESEIAEILPFKTHALQGLLAVVVPSNRLELKALFSAYDVRRHYGRVSLIQCRPGLAFSAESEQRLEHAGSIFDFSASVATAADYEKKLDALLARLRSGQPVACLVPSTDWVLQSRKLQTFLEERLIVPDIPDLGQKTLFTGMHPEHFFPAAPIIHLPLIAVQPLENYRDADVYFPRLAAYDWILFTSQHTVEYFFSDSALCI